MSEHGTRSEAGPTTRSCARPTHCTNCGHCLTGCPSRRCPECGTLIRGYHKPWVNLWTIGYLAWSGFLWQVLLHARDFVDERGIGSQTSVQRAWLATGVVLLICFVSVIGLALMPVRLWARLTGVVLILVTAWRVLPYLWYVACGGAVT